MRAVIYARYSAGKNQTDQSIEGQVRVCTKFCEAKGLTITEIYADRHISGKTDARPEFQRLMADSKKDLFDAVVVYKTDRLSRNKYDAVIYKRELKKAGIAIYYAAEVIPEGPEGIILESLMEGLAEYYSAELAQKIKRGMHESALKCRVIGSCMPLGYRASKDHTYEIEPIGAAIVRQIFEMYVDGKSQVEIVDYLNNHNYKTRQGSAFNVNAVAKILSNEKYTGLYEAAGVTIPGGMPVIIEPKQFALAQHMRARRAGGHLRSSTSNSYLLSGKMYCAYCKNPMVGVSGTSKSGARHYYYYCSTARRFKTCEKTHVSREAIERLVTDLTIDFLLSGDVLKNCVDKMLEIQALRDDREDRIKALNTKLAENKKAQNGLLGALEKGLGTDAILSRLDDLGKEAINIQGEIAYQKTKQFGLTRDQLEYFLEQFIKKEDESDEAYRTKILESFVNSVELSNDEIKIYYNLTDADGAESAVIKALDGVRPDTQKVDLDGYPGELIFFERFLCLCSKVAK